MLCTNRRPTKEEVAAFFKPTPYTEIPLGDRNLPNFSNLFQECLNLEEKIIAIISQGRSITNKKQKIKCFTDRGNRDTFAIPRNIQKAVETLQRDIHLHEAAITVMLEMITDELPYEKAEKIRSYINIVIVSEKPGLAKDVSDFMSDFSKEELARILNQ